MEGSLLMDLWYLDDGDVLMSPLLVEPFLKAYDEACTAKGAARNARKTEVHYWTPRDKESTTVEQWNLAGVERLATVKWNPSSTRTLGVETGETGAVVKQVKEKAATDFSMRRTFAKLGMPRQSSR